MSGLGQAIYDPINAGKMTYASQAAALGLGMNGQPLNGQPQQDGQPATVSGIPAAQQNLFQQLPQNAPGIGAPPAVPLWQQKRDYNTTMADSGYGAGMGPDYGPLGYGGASPGAGMGAYGGYGMGGASSGYGSGQSNGQLATIAAGMGAMGNVAAAQAGAVPGTIAANNAPGIQGGINQSNQAIAQGNNATQLGVAGIGKDTALGTAGIGAGASMYGADAQKAGLLGSTQMQTDAQKYAAQLQNQLGMAGIANQIPLTLAGQQLGQDKLSLAKQLMGSGGLGGVGIGGAGSGAAGAGAAGGGAPAGQPPLPQSQVVNPLLMQQAINQSQNSIAKRYAGLGNRLTQGMATRGFDVTGGLPAGMQEQLLANESPELTNASLQWNLGTAGQNAGQSNNVAQMGLTQYNTNQDRLLRQQLANMGLIGSLVS